MLPVAGPQQIVPRRRTSSTELHWISRPDDNAHHKPGGHEYAVIGRDLGDRDWAAIDPLPLRKSKGLRFGFTPSLYFWQPTGTHVWCESQEERWEVLWLEFSGQAERLWAQPMAITFGHRSRLSGYSHFPDLMALFADGSYGLLDVRPADRVDDAARVQFAETAAVCEALGWRYRVLTGHDKRATGNLDSLSASRHDRCRPGHETETLILSAARGGRSRGDLCQIASPDCPPLACAWVDNLAWRRLLHVDLGGVFNSETVYMTTEAASTGAAA